MTYSDTIIADGPLAYYHADASITSSASTVPNVGSAAGSATIGGTYSNITSGQPGAAQIGGSSFQFNNNTGYLTQNLTLANTSDFTIEYWFKHNTGFSWISGLIHAYHNGGNHNCQIAQGSTTAQMLVSINGTYVVNGVVTGINDGNWHHVVVTQSGGTVTLYVDGVNKLSGTGGVTATNTNTTFIWGAYQASGLDGWLDEVAFYQKALTSTQVSNHYTVGTTVPSVPVTVLPPYINVSTTGLTIPAPVVSIIQPNVTNVVPVMSLTLNTAAPVVSTTTNPFITPTPMTLSLAMPDAVVTAKTKITRTTTANNFTTGQYVLKSAGTTTVTPAWFEFDGSIPAGKQLDSATVRIPQGQYTAGHSFQLNLAYSRQASYASNATETRSALTVIASPTWGSVTSDYYYEVDVTSIVNSWKSGTVNNGFLWYRTDTDSGATETISAPQLVINVVDAPPAAINVTPPAMTLSVSLPDVTTIAGRSVSTDPPAASLSIDLIAPAVSTTVGSINVAPVATSTLTFTGGISVNPDFSATATVMTLSLSAPNAVASVQYPATVQPVYIQVGSLFTSPGVVDLTTNVLKVAPVMTLTLNWPGIYIEGADRYLTKVAGTVDQYTRWFKMDEGSGNQAADSAFGVNNAYKDAANLVGAIGYRVDGPQLRKAMHFNGVDSYIDTGSGWSAPLAGGSVGQNYRDYGTNGVNIEFSIKTTDTDGTIFAGGGGGLSGFNQSVIDNGHELRLTNGQLWLITGAGFQFKVRGTINDGQWHHVVFQAPDESSPADKATYINIDGHRIWTRLGGSLSSQWLPRSVMAKTTVPGPGATDFVAGDMRDFIVRMNYYMNDDLAQKMYYEWSNAMIVEPDVATATLSFAKPFSVKGNVKKMLAVYGLPWYTQIGTGLPSWTYKSVLSGMSIGHFQKNYDGSTSRAVDFTPHADWGFRYSVQYAKPVVTMLGDYLVYPVDINGQIDRSVDGVLNGEFDNMVGQGQLIDDVSGYARFLNLQDDLYDVTDFDVVTVVNYPAPTQNTTADTLIATEGVNDQHMPGYPAGSYPAARWTQARDDFRDSLLEAAYTGTNLWTPEIEMAKHLGFVQEYDHHEPGRYLTAGTLNNWGAQTMIPTSSAQTSATGGLAGSAAPSSGVTVGPMKNLAGYWIDQKHMQDPKTGIPVTVPSTPDRMAPTTQFDYLSDPQGNWYRRIVEVEAGLTDIPSWEYSEHVMQMATDPFDMAHSGYCYDVVDRMHGLQPGDRTKMSMYEVYNGRESWNVVPEQRFWVLSARPDGVAGKVIAREMDSYYGPFGSVVDNPFKNNVIAFVAERGTVVRGRSIRGRAFGDFMDSDLYQNSISEDAVKNVWAGSLTPYPPSTWSVDSRRTRSIALQLVTSKLLFDAKSGTFSQESNVVNYFNYGDGPGVINHPYVSMNMRGLKWLASTPLTSADDAVVYSPAISLTVSLPNAAFTADREVQVSAGAMRLDIEVRDAKNYRGNDVSEKATPMEMSLEMHGTGRVVTVPAVTLSLTLPDSVVDAGGDRIAVFLDDDRNITLFLKEDN